MAISAILKFSRLKSTVDHFGPTESEAQTTCLEAKA
jgi:hypothetical protein